jgi:hypothetical protein
MASVSQALTKAIPGLWRERSNNPDEMPQGLKFAPLNIALPGTSEYQILSTDLRLDQRDPRQGAALSDSADFAEGNIEYGTVTVATERHASLLYKIPQRVIDGLQGENPVLDLAGDAMKATSNQILDTWTRNFVTAAGDLDAAAALDLSAPAATDLVAYFDSEFEGIQLASGKTPNMVLMGRKVYHALANMDSIQSGPGVAIGSDSTATRRLDWTARTRVAEFFRSLYGCEIAVENRTYINSAGAPKYALETELLIGHVDPRGGCMATFAQDADVIRFYVQDLTLPSPEGVGVAADARYKVTASDPLAGRIAAVTL